MYHWGHMTKDEPLRYHPFLEPHKIQQHLTDYYHKFLQFAPVLGFHASSPWHPTCLAHHPTQHWAAAGSAGSAGPTSQAAGDRARGCLGASAGAERRGGAEGVGGARAGRSHVADERSASRLRARSLGEDGGSGAEEAEEAGQVDPGTG